MSVFPFFDSRSAYCCDPTLIFIPYDLRDIGKKDFFHRGIYANFCAPAAVFSLSEPPKASLVYAFIIARYLQALHLEILFF